MATVSSNFAASAYRDATRVAEKIIADTESGQAGAVTGSSSGKVEPAFSELVAGSLQQARDVGYNKEGTSTKAIANEAELHDLVGSVANAELTLNTVVAIRDRVINAYQDIVKMPI